VATTDMGRKRGLLCPFRSVGPRLTWPTFVPSGILIHPAVGGCAPFPGGAGSPSNTMSLGPRPTSLPSGVLIHRQQIWAENWGAGPLWGGGAGSPSNTMWPAPRPTCTPSFILIHSTVWPQYTNVADKTDRQTGQTDNGLIAQGEPFYKRSPQNGNN